MSLVAVKMKLMPSSPEADLNKVQNDLEVILKDKGASNPRFEEEPIAFGLKAIITTFGWPEEKELEELEKNLGEIENVNSVELIDIRRAIG